MSIQKFIFKISQVTLALCLSLAPATSVLAATLNLSDSPLTVTQSVPPLTMLVMSKDHKTFVEAYDDYSDIDDDGVIDTHYKPSIDYYGYFDSYKCYAYYNSGGTRYFYPTSVTTTKKCSGTWSGDWLNYMTMSRLDTLRKALYGGKRQQTEATNTTFLVRAEIPQDGHTWGKEYTSEAVDGYRISDYTPLSQPNNNKRHLFANVTLANNSQNNGYLIGKPTFRVLQNQTLHVWDWVSKERPVAGQQMSDGSTVAPTEYEVNVKVCDSSVGLEGNCRLYPNGQYKPIGLLQQFGENQSMKFGLLTGSYEKNLSGGVLRKNVNVFTDEINQTTGQINTATNGIIKTIDALKIPDFGASNYEYNGGFYVTGAPPEGLFKAWGNPMAEMVYETLRYYAGKSSPTSAFATSGGVDGNLGLPAPSWVNPYSANPYCSKPNILVISDTSPSYDSNQIPGSYFGSFSGDLNPSFNAQSLSQTIWNQEKGTSTLNFIGQSASTFNSAPTPKTVSSFGNIRGLPYEPTKEGSYYSAAATYYGWLNDLNVIQDPQKLYSYVLALSNPLPEIKIAVGGKTVTLVPFAKTVGGCSVGGGTVSAAQGSFQPSDEVVDFYIESLTPTSGVFRVNFADMEQGADYDMDAIARYSYTVANNTLTIQVSSDYAAGCLIQHMGYVISGTSQDGVYLEVRDSDTSINNDIIYFLDTPPATLPGQRNTTTKLPLINTRVFSPSSSPAATILENPLFYAAKWGGFFDKNNNSKPDLQDEWDTDHDGVPDNYFLVTNPTMLERQLSGVLNNILKRATSASSSSVNTGSLNEKTRIYQVLFNGANWTGQVLSFPIAMDGSIDRTGTASQGALWDGAELLDQKDPDARNILTFKPSNKKGVAFRWPGNINSPGSSEMDNSQSTILNTNPDTSALDSNGQKRLNYIRGVQTYEQSNGGIFRNRTSRLGDIVNAAPMYVGPPSMPYFDKWPGSAAENNVPYSAFKTQYAGRASVLYVGANDGMLHGFNAENGQEMFAYIPARVFNNLNKLTSQTYNHRFFVDGSPNVLDVFYGGAWHTVLAGGLNKGGQGIYALDVTDPSSVTEGNAAQKVLWEFNDSDDVDLGYTFSQPALVRQGDGKWVAIFGNGYNNNESDGKVSTTGNAVIYVVDIATGALLQKLDSGKGITQDPNNTSLPNGMSTPVVVDLNGDYVADTMYAGDLHGNLWKLYWDTGSNTWKYATYGTGQATPLFSARNAQNKAQPITERPTIRRMQSGIQVYFGTGKYLESSDKNVVNAPTQSFYSIIDNLDDSISSGRVTSRSQLLQQSIIGESSFIGSGNNSYNVRTTSNNYMTTGQRGWYMDLVSPANGNQGERQITNPILRNNRIIFTTLIPDSDVCGYGGTGWLMELDAYSGARLTYSPFDLDGDGKFNNNDQIGSGANAMYVSGVKSKVGVIPSPSIISAGSVEYKYMPGSNGQIGQATENPGASAIGRQSWREVW